MSEPLTPEQTTICLIRREFCIESSTGKTGDYLLGEIAPDCSGDLRPMAHFDNWEDAHFLLHSIYEARAQAERILVLEAELDQLRRDLAEARAAIVAVHGPRGCACINDLPGDNYTCEGHRVLFRIARAQKPERKGEG